MSLVISLAVGAAAGGLREIDSPHYTLQTDVTPDMAREAVVRMTKMADEYERRLRPWSPRPLAKLPFRLYRQAADYYATGARGASLGVFTGDALLAIAPTGSDWHVVQHEGFHQFAASLGVDLPPWLNEGLAEYFGESLFTGGGYTTGLIPKWRLQRLQRELRAGGLRPLTSLLSLSPDEWNRRIFLPDYDQAWSLVQFFAHAREGKYQQPFEKFLTRLARGETADTALEKELGNAADIERQWRDYWKALPPDSTDGLYARSALVTVAGFLGRAEGAGQRFTTYEAFSQAAGERTLRVLDEDWLPSGMLVESMASLHAIGVTLTLERDPAGSMFLRVAWPDGSRSIAQCGNRSTHQFDIVISDREPSQSR